MLQSIYFLSFHVPWKMPCTFVRGEENLLLEHPASNLCTPQLQGPPKYQITRMQTNKKQAGSSRGLAYGTAPRFVKTMPINPLRTRELRPKLLDVFVCSINTY